MFSKSFFATVAVFLSLSIGARAQAAISPALGIQGTPGSGNVQQPSDAAPCGTADLGAIDQSTAVTASNDEFTVTVLNFISGTDGSREVTAKIDPTATGQSFVTAQVLQNGDKDPTDTGSQQLKVQIPAGTTCTGGASGTKCLVSFVTDGGFGNCVVVDQPSSTNTGTGNGNNNNDNGNANANGAGTANGTGAGGPTTGTGAGAGNSARAQGAAPGAAGGPSRNQARANGNGGNPLPNANGNNDVNDPNRDANNQDQTPPPAPAPGTPPPAPVPTPNPDPNANRNHARANRNGGNPPPNANGNNANANVNVNNPNRNANNQNQAPPPAPAPGTPAPAPNAGPNANANPNRNNAAANPQGAARQRQARDAHLKRFLEAQKRKGAVGTRAARIARRAAIEVLAE